jgi:hypothetical protein
MSLASKLLVSSGSPTGEQVFTSSGTWTAPKGVYLVSVVAIGQGGNGARETGTDSFGNPYDRSYGGGGGGLGWRNNIQVAPEQSYIVRVLSTGSYFISINTVWGESGKTRDSSVPISQVGGIYIGDGGGNGGEGRQANKLTNPEYTIGGGGDAGNYNSDGGISNSVYGVADPYTTVPLGEGSGISGNDIGNYGYGGTEYLSGSQGVVQIRWGVNKDFS